jgi:NAD(P)-dependent dehydrogenase (short-subunit alcohol dehydrogenase family)
LAARFAPLSTRSLTSCILCHDAAMEQLGDKVAVVTGAGSGIGRALVRRFAAEGMRVVAADIEDAALAETVDGLDRTSAFVADVARYDDVDALAEHTYETFGSTDVLCNNAGVFAGGFIWERPPSDFEWTLGVNLWGILHAVRAFVPRMLAAAMPAHIVNTVSIAGLCSTAYSGPYSISKFAALAATESLAHDLRAINAPIRVSAVVPAAVNTRIAASARNRPDTLPGKSSDDARFVEGALADLTATHGAPPEDVAALVVDAIRTEQFLVPTKPSFARQLRERYEALLEKQLPPMPNLD